MSKCRLFVGNFPFSTTEQDLRDLFSPGDSPRNITEVRIIRDRESGKSRGFGFVEMATDDEAADALQLDGTVVGERPLRVSLANERPSRDDNRRPGRDGQRRDHRRGRGRDAHGWR